MVNVSVSTLNDHQWSWFNDLECSSNAKSNHLLMSHNIPSSKRPGVQMIISAPSASACGCQGRHWWSDRYESQARRTWASQCAWGKWSNTKFCESLCRLLNRWNMVKLCETMWNCGIRWTHTISHRTRSLQKQPRWGGVAAGPGHLLNVVGPFSYWLVWKLGSPNQLALSPFSPLSSKPLGV